MTLIADTLGFMPTPGSMATLSYGERAFRLAEQLCPLERATTRYVKQGAGGSATGGSGNGLTPATAWEVRHLADLRTLILANMTTNMAMLMRDGDEFRPDLTSSATVTASNVRLAALGFGNFTIGRYADPAVANVSVVANSNTAALGPKFMGSELYAAGGWTQDGTYTNCWFRDPPNATTIPVYTVHWAELDPIDGWYAGLSPQTFRVYGAAASTLGVTGAALTTALTAMNAANEDAFVRDSATGRIYVRPRSEKASIINTTARLNGVVATTDCFTFPDHSGIRLDGTTAVGWGMNAVASQLYPEKFLHTGAKIALCTNTTTGYSGHHATGHLISGAGPIGGSMVYRGCKSGFTDGDSLGNATAWVAFNNVGKNQVVFSCCELIYGNLKTPRTGTTAAPSGVQQAFYSHGGVGANSPTLVCIDRCRISKFAVEDGGSVVELGAADLGVDVDPKDPASWQCRLILCRQPDGPLSSFTYSGYLMLCATIIEMSFYNRALLSSAQIPFCMISSILHINLRRLPGTANFNIHSLSAASGGGTWKGKAHHYYSGSRVSWSGRPNQTLCVYDRFTLNDSIPNDTNAAWYCQAWNTEFMSFNASRVNSEPNFVGMYDRPPNFGGQGGMQNCSFVNTQKTTLSAFAPNPMRGSDLSGSPFFNLQPITDALTHTGFQFPAAPIPDAPWLKPQYDVNGDYRVDDSVGPFSYRSPGAAGGGNSAVAIPAPHVMSVNGTFAGGMRTRRG